jgi:hypothetical protein
MIEIRAGRPESDRDQVLKLYTAHLNPRYDEARYDWLYHGNPAGPGRLWVATDPATDAIVGTAAAFPRRVWVAGQPALAWVLGDFCVAEALRSVGPALRLQRRCLTDLQDENAAFTYDFPNPGMLAIHARLGLPVFGQMVRMARPLRVEARLPRWLGAGLVARLVAGTGNRLLRLRAGARRNGLVVAAHQGSCGPEFSRLAATLGSRVEGCLDRSADYLNWRYLANPHAPHEIFTARRRGELLAWGAVLSTGDHALVADLAAIDADALRELFAGMADMLYARKVATVSAVLMAGHPWLETLRAHGFGRREAHPIVLQAATTQVGRPASSAGAWLFTYGDRDS